jgi:acetyl esterase
MSDILPFSQTPGLAHRGRVGARSFALIDGAGETIDPSAAGVLARLAHGGPRSEVTAIEARKRYAESRAPLIAPAEPVGGIYDLRPATAGIPKLTIIRPAGIDLEEMLPALIYLHGGGWMLGELDIYEPFMRTLANATGSAIVWVHYRLSPEYPFPAALDDTWAACQWVQRNAVWLNIDVTRIGIGGDSAGGNLAAVTAIAARDRRIDFDPLYQALLYPCVDLTASLPSHRLFSEGYLLTADLYAWYRRNYLGERVSPADWRVSPLFASSFSDVAPALILYGGFDPLRDEAAAYAARLRGAEVEVERLYFPGQIHGFLTMGGAIPAARAAIDRIGVIVRAYAART